ncbi:MAG: sulfurtransferase complex subunit TusB [Gammaproteobacteria bacterium]|nr:sulfurtransferase complex subunit TusB [Gammaproteobacteria bacterium]
MILHTLGALPDSAAFNDCMRLCRQSDALLLLGDGVYAACPNTQALYQLSALGIELYALTEDLAAAGIHCEGTTVQPVDMDGFVELTERYSRQMAWY